MIELKQKWRDIFMRYDNNDNYSVIFHNLLTLISTKNLTDKTIDKLVSDTNDELDKIPLYEIKDSLELIEGLLNELELDCIELEMYETCSNIKRFKKCIYG